MYMYTVPMHIYIYKDGSYRWYEGTTAIKQVQVYKVNYSNWFSMLFLGTVRCTLYILHVCHVLSFIYHTRTSI